MCRKLSRKRFWASGHTSLRPDLRLGQIIGNAITVGVLCIIEDAFCKGITKTEKEDENMAAKEYRLSKTKTKIARENGLVPAESRYYSGNDLYYDFSLLDSIVFDDPTESEILKRDLMEHHAVSWFQQPLPTILKRDNFTYFTGQFQTVVHRIYNKVSGKRICVIVEVTGIRMERQTRNDVWSELKTEQIYEAESRNYDADYEVA